MHCALGSIWAVFVEHFHRVRVTHTLANMYLYTYIYMYLLFYPVLLPLVEIWFEQTSCRKYYPRHGNSSVVWKHLIFVSQPQSTDLISRTARSVFVFSLVYVFLKT